MEKETMGKIISVSRQWWFKVNTKPMRTNALDGATFPHIIKVKYSVDGKDYSKRKWLGAWFGVPHEGGAVKVLYREDNPQKAKIVV